jgi:hypothetical protein
MSALQAYLRHDRAHTEKQYEENFIGTFDDTSEFAEWWIEQNIEIQLNKIKLPKEVEELDLYRYIDLGKLAKALTISGNYLYISTKNSSHLNQIYVYKKNRL